MIIGYTLPNAIHNIAFGIKIHTVRVDAKERFKVGMTLDHCTGVRTKKFKKHITNTCKRIDKVFIDPRTKTIKINGIELSDLEKAIFAFNDGFDSIQGFWKWFTETKNYRLIQWTDFKYTV